jgi:hypothetical protein
MPTAWAAASPKLQEALRRLSAGEAQTDIARSYGVSHVTIGRLQGAILRPFDDASAAVT